MSRWFIDKTYLSDELVNDRICQVTCLLNDPTRFNERKISFIQEVLPRYLGEVKSDEYDVEVEMPYVTTATLAADIDDTVLTFALTAGTFMVVSKDSYIKIGNELMIIESVNSATNEVTVYQRGHGGVAVAHTTDEVIETLANVKATCELLGDCRRPNFKDKIKNATQLVDDCITYCKKDMCKKLADNCDVTSRDRVIADAVEKQKLILRKNYLEQLDNLFINGAYGSIDKNGKVAYTTRGLRQWVLGTEDEGGVTHSGFVYDILAEDACVGTAGNGTGALTYDALQNFYVEAGKKSSPQWNRVILNYNSYLALDAIADKSDKCCTTGGQDKNLKNTLLGNTISTPYGDVEVKINDHMADGEIIFYNVENIGWLADCSVNGNVLTEQTFDLDFEDKNKKIGIESYIAFDAAQNMCSDLAIIYNFTKSTQPCA